MAWSKSRGDEQEKSCQIYYEETSELNKSILRAKKGENKSELKSMLHEYKPSWFYI